MLITKIKDFLKFVCALILSHLCNWFGIGKDLWIITERRSECKDNGYHFFKYMREKHPQKNVFYAIEKTSTHINKVEQLGNVLYFNSFKHYLYACLATRLIGAFNPVGIPNSISFYKFRNLIKGKRVYLKHGIIKEYIEKSTYPFTKYDMFCCGAAPEFEYIINNFGYPKDVVKYVGLCRYDNLSFDNFKKKILLMPTWRQYLPSQTWKMQGVDNFKELEQTFLKSDYYAHYSSLLKNPELIDFLDRNGYVLIFYLHHELQQFTSVFETSNRNIVLANNSDYDVQLLLKESEFLITDYSSVAFDFAYMSKPMVYYQFDEEEYYKSHYNKGYFDYDTMGFGAVAKNESNLMESLINSFDAEENHFYTEEKYTDRTKNFFTMRDRFNCQRTYEAIINL